MTKLKYGEILDRISEWEDSTIEIVKAFVGKYFPDYSYKEDVYWVGNVIGEVFCIADYFFDLNQVIVALKENATPDQLFDYYDKALEAAHEDAPFVNLKTYLKTHKGKTNGIYTD